jgi:hypothetical protein
MHMARKNRQLIRFYFILVIIMGLFGGWYASRTWQIDPAGLEQVNLGDQGDWIDYLATLGEESIQLFLGFTSNE